MTSEVDRRRQPRFKVSVPVQLSTGEHVLRGVLKDLCREAALVGIKDGLDMGSAVSLILQLPGTGGPLQIGGKVVRVSVGEPGTLDVAILFDHVTAAAETRIDFFIALQAG
jgi:PilZ domain